MSSGGPNGGAQRLEADYELDRVASFDLSRDVSAPARARHAVEQLMLTAWSVRGRQLIDDVLLLTSELVTNAVCHGVDRLTLRVALGAVAVEVSVEDGSPLLPTRPSLLADNAYREGGRGLVIVSLLADEWGVDQRPSAGKRVWARLTRSTSS